MNATDGSSADATSISFYPYNKNRCYAVLTIEAKKSRHLLIFVIENKTARHITTFLQKFLELLQKIGKLEAKHYRP